MLTGKEDLLQALVEAYLMEKGTKEFYSQASTKSSSNDARKSFEELAIWENQHMTYIQSLYQSILDDRELEGFRDFSEHARASMTEAGLPVAVLEKKIKTYTIRNEKDALSLSLDIEAKSYKLYKGLAAKAGDPETQVIFEEMMAQETKHLEHINTLKRKLAGK